MVLDRTILCTSHHCAPNNLWCISYTDHVTSIRSLHLSVAGFEKCKHPFHTNAVRFTPMTVSPPPSPSHPVARMQKKKIAVSQEKRDFLFPCSIKVVETAPDVFHLQKGDLVVCDPFITSYAIGSPPKGFSFAGLD